MKRAICEVWVDGRDISFVLSPVLISLRVSDKAGTTSDTATIDLDDRGGHLILPPQGARLVIRLGFSDEGVAVVFTGVVDEIRSRGGRGGGRVLTISAKGFDTRGKAKAPQQRHFDRKTVREILEAAGRAAGLDDVRVDEAFAGLVRDYEWMDDESFIALGERLAGELGGTFKVAGNRAVLAKRNGGRSPSGAALPTVTAAWGANLIDWDIAPFLGRARYKRTRARWYDQKDARWREVLAEVETEDAEADHTARYSAPGDREALQRAQGDAAESARRGGEGTITIDGNIGAQPEGLCVLTGARPGIDGTYRIDGVEHQYDRRGFVTTISVKQPQGEAGKDSRAKTTGEADEANDFALPRHQTLG